MIEAAIVLMVFFTISIISDCSVLKRETPTEPCEIIVPPEEDLSSNSSNSSNSDSVSDCEKSPTKSSEENDIPSYYDVIK